MSLESELFDCFADIVPVVRGKEKIEDTEPHLNRTENKDPTTTTKP